MTLAGHEEPREETAQARRQRAITEEYLLKADSFERRNPYAYRSLALIRRESFTEREGAEALVMAQLATAFETFKVRADRG